MFVKIKQSVKPKIYHNFGRYLPYSSSIRLYLRTKHYFCAHANVT